MCNEIMYVLTVTPRDHDAETRVVGVFDTQAGMAAAKEQWGGGVDAWWASWEIHAANVFYHEDAVTSAVVESPSEVAACAERARVDAERRLRCAEKAHEAVRAAESRRAAMDSAIRARCSSTAAGGLTPTAPTEVLEHLADLTADVESLSTTIDPCHLPALHRRLKWYVRRSAAMRRMLSVASDLATFDRITEAAHRKPTHTRPGDFYMYPWI